MGHQAVYLILEISLNCYRILRVTHITVYVDFKECYQLSIQKISPI